MQIKETMKIEIIKREIIKPISPTPSHLKTFKLSLFDQIQPVVYGPIVLFYAKNNHITSDQRSNRLKSSLSETLARFYPIAGRITGNATIECNDDGAQFVEARCHGLLSALLSAPEDPKTLHKFLPVVIESQEAGTWPLLLVQATRFACGGLAVGVCLSHKFADATTMGIFMRSWAQTSAGATVKTVPVFSAASYFPVRDVSAVELPAVELKEAVECSTRRFVFDSEKIIALKAKMAGGVRNPSKVEAVTALICKCAMRAAVEKRKKLVVLQSVDIRRRADPPLPENLAGNLVGHFTAEILTDEAAKVSLWRLAGELRKGLVEYGETKGKRLRGEKGCQVVVESMREARELFVRDDISVMIFTSLVNFGLYEGVDFGWGRPAWLTVPAVSAHRNVVTLMDSCHGGVEAWVTLSQRDMALFEADSLLLDFVS